MKMYPRTGEKRRFDDIDVDDEEAIGTLCRLSSSGHVNSPGCTMENEKRIRREIANSNERRRMQSINAGFASLKQLLPNTDGEKLSKAAILQQTADYIYKLEHDKKDLMTQNNTLKKYLQQQESTDGSSSDSEAPMSEILSTIKDLHNNPTATTKLPNTEFRHKVRRVEGSEMEARVEEVAAVEEVSAVCLKEEYDNRSASEAMAQIRGDTEKERKKKTHLGEKVKALVHPINKKKREEEHMVKSEESTVKVGAVQRCYGVKQQTTNGYPKTTTATIVTIIPPEGLTTNHTSILKQHSNRRMAKSINSPNLMEMGGLPNHLPPPPTMNKVLRKVEVEPTSRVPTPEQIEYMQVSSNSSPSHQEATYAGESLILAPSNNKLNNQSSQKSLDTICEAIRHLEGDFMFATDSNGPPQEHVMQQIGANTYEVHELKETPVIHQETENNVEMFRRGTKLYRREASPKSYSPASPSPPSSSIGLSILSSPPRHNEIHHPHSNIIYGLTKDLISSEPQEVPLELTTTHRIERINPQSSTIMSRPNVIVVKQA